MHHFQSSKNDEQEPPRRFAGIGAMLEKSDRLLVPVKQVSDVEAVLSYLLTLDRGADAHLAIVHVTSTTAAISSPAHSCNAEILLEKVASRCHADSIAHESYILAGDLVFSILDAAEMLGCDAIVLPVLKTRPWHFFFGIAREMQRLRRDVPLVLINADGVVIRSIRT